MFSTQYQSLNPFFTKTCIISHFHTFGTIHEWCSNWPDSCI